MFCGVGIYFDFIIVRAENTVSHKHTTKGQDVLGAISEVVGNSVLIPSQNSINNFSLKCKSATKQHFLKKANILRI